MTTLTPSAGLNTGFRDKQNGWGGAVNQNWQRLDLLSVPFVLSANVALPPDNPVDGDRYIVPANALGLWSDKGNQIAVWSDTQWLYYVPKNGWKFTSLTEKKALLFDGTQWGVWVESLPPDVLAKIDSAIASGTVAQTAAAQTTSDKAAVTVMKQQTETARDIAATSATNAQQARSGAIAARDVAQQASIDAAAARDGARESEQNAMYAAQQLSASVSGTAANAQLAQNAAISAQSSAANALASWQSLDGRYLGGKATAPTTNNQGGPLTAGMLYLNSTDNQLYVYANGTWYKTTPNSTIQVSSVIASANQTTFNTPVPFQPGANTVDVYVNGARFNIGIDYTEANDGNSITLAAPVSVGGDQDEVTIRVIQTLAFGSTASNLVTHGGSTVEDALDAINLPDYDALRSYVGSATRFYITGYLVSAKPSGIAGPFVLDPSDNSTADNNATVLSGAGGKRYKRQYSGLASVAWFNAKGDGVSAAGTAIQAAIDSGLSLWVPDGDYIIDRDLTITDRTFIVFDKKAVFKASANGRTFFKSTSHAYFSQIHNPQLNGNGKTDVAGFDLLNMRLNSGIFNPFITMMETGIIGRDGCFGLHIQNPTAYAVKKPLVLMANNSGMEVITPNFDNSALAGGDNSGVGVDVQSGSGSNLGVIIRGGYIQGFGTGVQDAGIGTVIDSTYFEACTSADISGISGARNSRYLNLQHWGGVGACAYKLRNVDAATIVNPTMGSGARTAMFDIDTSNTNCTGSMSKSNAALNTPVGVVTGILLSNYAQGFTVTDASGASLLITNNVQSILSISGKVVTITGDITYPTNSNGSFAAIALPYPALSGTAVNAAVGYSSYGSALTLYGTGSSMNVLLASTGAALTNANLSGKRLTFTATYVAA